MCGLLEVACLTASWAMGDMLPNFITHSTEVPTVCYCLCLSSLEGAESLIKDIKTKDSGHLEAQRAFP